MNVVFFVFDIFFFAYVNEIAVVQGDIFLWNNNFAIIAFAFNL